MTWQVGRKVRDSQPQCRVKIDWSNPITKGLVFCAVPYGNTLIDLVTGVVGTPNGNISNSPRPENAGKSRRGNGRSVNGGGATTDYVQWPISDTLRGGNITQVGTLLCLGGTTEQVDGKFYEFGGTAELPNGYGFGLAIDSGLDSARGPILTTLYAGSRKNSSYPNTPLGTTDFGNKTHLFGYSFNSNGAAGSFFGARSAYAFTGVAHGVATAGRRMTVLQPSASGSFSSATYVLQFLVWDREISTAEYQRIYDNPWQLFEPVMLPWFFSVGGAPQLLAPIADLSAGGWTPSTGSDLYAVLDEGTASDADYVVSTTATSCELRIAVGSDPAVSTGHILRYRLLAGSGAVTAVLKQGSTTIASYGPHTLTGSAQDFSQTLTGGEADSITDYSDLRVVFTAS